MPSRHTELLERLASAGMKPGFERIERLVEGLDIPPVVIVGGTNGKGSTCIFLESILKAHGLSTVVYIQPHLVNVTERFRIDGSDISFDLFDECLDRLLPIIEGMEDAPTYFEVMTAVAGILASEHPDAAPIFEVGLGGRLDAVNHFRKKVIGITSVSLDHTGVLGTSIEEISLEKSAILHRGVPAVSSASGGALDIILAEARAKGSPARALGIDVSHVGSWRSFDVIARGRYSGLAIGIPGKHMVENAVLAIALSEDILGEPNPDLVASALAKAFIPGRFQILNLKRRRVILDCAHNPSAVRALTASLEGSGIRPDAVVFASMSDKDIGGMLIELPGSHLVLTTVGHPRSAHPDDLQTKAKALSLESVKCRDAESAMVEAVSRVPINGTILVTGSNYLVGALLEGQHRSIM